MSLMVLYLLELNYLLYYYINLPRDFSNEIKSNQVYFDYMQLKHQTDIVETTVYHKIVKKELFGKNKAYNDKKYVM